ncbi:MAG TPA: hypothetical protein VF998_02840 [Candidatus Limnocylindria bacterium]
MRYATRGAIAALVSATATALVAFLSALRLTTAPTRGRIDPDPLASAASLVAFVVGVAAFFWLGRSIGRDGATARMAVMTGCLAGAVAGLAGGSAQAIAISDYLGQVLGTYSVPPELLTIVLVTYVVLATIGATLLGGAIAYIGWHRGIRRATA